MACRLAAFALAAMIAALAPSTALADKGPNERKAAAHFRQGRAYFEQGLYGKALREFDAAYDLVPRALILFHIARAYEKTGDRARALENYRKFVALEPDGKVPDEARAEIARIEKQLAEETAAAREREAEQERLREEQERRAAQARADAHVTQARAFSDAGAHASAVTEYEQAYELVRDPELLFEIAAAHRAGDAKEKAREQFLRYLIEAPSGPRVDQAREQVAELTREIELGDQLAPAPERAPPAASEPTITQTLASAPGHSHSRDRARDRDTGPSWKWVGIGAAALAAGVLADVAPASASNGELDAMDFVPLGLYGVGATFVVVGAF